MGVDWKLVSPLATKRGDNLWKIRPLLHCTKQDEECAQIFYALWEPIFAEILPAQRAQFLTDSSLVAKATFTLMKWFLLLNCTEASGVGG